MAQHAEGPPTLSIVIPTSRAGADLESCLESIAAQDYAKLEVTVVDNASTGVPARLFEQLPGVLVVRNDENLGFVGACNRGLEASTGDLVLFLNDDTLVEQGALGALVDSLVERPTWGACQAKLLLMDDPTRLDTAGSFLTATGFLVHRGAYGPESEYVSSDEIFAAKGAALLVRRKALEDAGAFDPEFFAYFEDSDLCWRLWLAGWKVGFAADARVRHRLGSTASSFPSEQIQFHSFKNRICSLLKNLGGARLTWMLPLHLGLCLGLAAWFALQGRPGLSRAVLRAIAWNARHVPSTLRKRARIQRGRRITDRALVPRISAPVSPATLLGYARTAAGPRSQTRVG